MNKFLLPLAFCSLTSVALAQCPNGSQPSGTELVVNGDFESGNTGFTSVYNYTPPPNTTEGQYWVGTGQQVSTWNGGMTSNGDHTSGTGKLLLVNGSPASGADIWCQTITVSPNTTYIFSAWVSTFDPPNPAILQFAINGTTLGSPFTAPSATGVWTSFNATWNSANNTSITICILDQNTSVGGNDFGLDDISFQQCGCGFTVNAGNDVSFCSGDSVTLNPGAASAYLWFPSSGLSCSTCQSPKASPAQTTTYTLVASNGSGCTDSDEVVLTVYPPVHASAGNDVAICSGGNTVLEAGGGISYQWQPASGLSGAATANPVASPATTTTYTVLATDGNECTGTDNVVVTVYPPVNASAGPDTSLCPGQSAQLQASGGNSYIWLPADGLSNSAIYNPVVTPVENNTYTVTVTSDNQCTAEAMVTINVFPDFSTGISNDTTICAGENLTLKVSGGASYTWQPVNFLSCDTCSTVMLTPSGNVNYTVKIFDRNGCEKVQNVSITLKNGCLDIFMPSAFSPNNDGKNDFLIPLGSKIEKITWSVYNRWGEKIFTTDNPNVSWDGKYKNQDEPVDVYVWYLHATLKDGTVTTMKGNVTLLR